MKHVILRSLVRPLFALGLLLTVGQPPAQAQGARPTAHRISHTMPTARAAHGGSNSHFAHRPQRVNAVVPGQEVRYYWDGTTWVNPRRYAYTYDAGARVTQEIESDSASGVPDNRYTTTYNAQGLETEAVSQSYSSGAWVNQSRTLRTYDSYGNETSYQGQQWQNNAWVCTTDCSQTSYVYNAAGIPSEITTQRLDNGAYVNDRRETFTFSNGQWSAILEQEWDGSAWVNRYQDLDLTWATWGTNWADQRIAHYREQEWVNGTFVDSSRADYTYGPYGSESGVREKPTGPGGAWQSYSRYAYNEDAYGHQTAYVYERWRANAWVINYAYQYNLTYGTGGELLRQIEQNYDTNTGQYRNASRSNYGSFLTIPTGLPAEATAADLTLYPNPTTGAVTLEVPATSGPATVRNALGQVMLTAPAAAGAVRLDLSTLPAGVYSVTLLTPAGTVSRRVVRQ